MIGPVVGGVEGDGDELLAVPQGAGNQGPSRLVGVARFQAGAPLIPPQQFVVVGQAPPGNEDRPGGNDGPQFLPLQYRPGQNGHIVGGGVVVRVIQTIGVCKVGVVHAQLGGLFVHLRHEALHVSPAVACNGQGRVVARGEHQPVEQSLQGDLLLRLEVHGRALRPRPLTLDGYRGGQVGMEFHRHQGGHQFGDAGDAPLFPGVFLIEHPPALFVHQDGRGGGQGGFCPENGQNQQRQNQQKGAPAFQNSITSHRCR